jgi:hypothetical protein
MWMYMGMLFLIDKDLNKTLSSFFIKLKTRIMEKILKHIKTIFGAFLIVIILGVSYRISFVSQESIDKETNLTTSSPNTSIILDWSVIWGNNYNENPRRMVLEKCILQRVVIMRLNKKNY